MNKKIKRKGARKRLYQVYGDAERFISVLDNDLRAKIFEYFQKYPCKTLTQKEIIRKFKRSQPIVSQALSMLVEIGALRKSGKRRSEVYYAADVSIEFYNLSNIGDDSVVSPFDQVDID